jgi:hypothetical protein
MGASEQILAGLGRSKIEQTRPAQCLQRPRDTDLFALQHQMVCSHELPVDFVELTSYWRAFVFVRVCVQMGLHVS